MRSLFHPLLGLMAVTCCGAALAQAARAAPVPAAPASAASAASTAQSPAHVRVIEDDNVRIEETHGRTGAVSKITVHTKQPGTKDYDVQVAPAGRDPNQDKGSAGRRTWSVLNF